MVCLSVSFQSYFVKMPIESIRYPVVQFEYSTTYASDQNLPGSDRRDARLINKISRPVRFKEQRL